MGEKPYTDWVNVKTDMRKWRTINIGCTVIALLFVIAGAAAETLSEPLGIDFNMAPTSYFLLAIVFAVMSVTPHMQVVMLKWFGLYLILAGLVLSGIGLFACHRNLIIWCIEMF